jgi:hypothetical protein
MAFNGIKRRLEYLREQPEPVRLRAATLLTGASGLAITLIWLVLLLPLQIRLHRPDAGDTEPLPEQALLRVGQDEVGSVSGARTQTTPTISPLPLLPRNR